MNSYDGKTQSTHRRKYPGQLQPMDRQTKWNKETSRNTLDNNWITDFEEYFPDLDNFSSLDYSTLTEGQNRTKKQVKTSQLDNSWINFGKRKSDQ